MIKEDHTMKTCRMKKPTLNLPSLLLAGGLVAIASAASARPTQAVDPLQASFAGLPAGAVERLTAGELDSIRGQWLPAFVFGVVGADLALSAYFWGVYVPNYTAAGGGCLSCAGTTNLK
jgi:hypothetical protein